MKFNFNKMLLKLPKPVAKNISNGVTKVQKHLPEILIVAGTGCVVAGTVVACKNTIKAADALDERKKDMEVIRAAKQNGKTESGEPYSVEDYKKDTVIVAKKTGLELVKAYGPAVALEGVGLAMIFKSHGIMRDRFTGVAAAYTSLNTAYQNYRQRVRDAVGEQKEDDIYKGITRETVEVTEVDENGKKKKTKQEVVTQNHIDQFSIIFEDGCTGWTKSPELNKARVLSVQEYCNQLLQIRGYLYLKDVYEEFGIDTRHNQALHYIGWYYDPEDPTCHNYVDFGLGNTENSRIGAFMNGYETNVLLTFNYDGDIVRKMG